MMFPELGKYVRGNDSADAAIILQDMINNYGGAYIETPGIYRLSAPITLTDKQSLVNRGNVRNAQLKAMFTNDDICYVENLNGGVVEGIEFRYNGVPNNDVAGLRVGRAYQSAFRRLRFINVGKGLAQTYGALVTRQSA